MAALLQLFGDDPTPTSSPAAGSDLSSWTEVIQRAVVGDADEKRRGRLDERLESYMQKELENRMICLLYTSPSPRDS